MSRFSVMTAQIFLMTALTGGLVQAQTGSDILQKRIKTSLNGMVQEVREAPTAQEKRLVMDQFISKIDRGTGLIEKMPFLSDDQHAAIDFLQARFDGYAVTLHGTTASTGSQTEAVADSDLDAFASFMQNDLEQADGGGVYLSTGAIIIVLLIILILL